MIIFFVCWKNDIIYTNGERVGLASEWASNNVIQSVVY